MALGQLVKKSRRRDEVDFTDVLKNGLNLDRCIEGRHPLSTYCRRKCTTYWGTARSQFGCDRVELGEEQSAGWHNCRRPRQPCSGV